jgi:ribosomal-protein-alanine N-acetyltransferase
VPTLLTQRCRLVDLKQVSDTLIIDYYLANAEHLRNSGGPRRDTRAQVQTMLESWRLSTSADSDMRFLLLLGDQVIGSIGVSNIVRGAFQAAYLGYNISQDQQGKGLMTEALTAVTYYAFNDLNLHRLMANYRPENAASARVLEKLDFIKEGIAKNYLMVDGQWCDHVLTSKTNPNWTANP